MNYFESESGIPITEHREEMVSIGKELFALKRKVYDERMMKIIWKTINEHLHDATESKKEDAMYAAIYDYWVYGNNIAEEFYFDFPHKNDAEKRTYMTFRTRFLYINHLNSKATRHFLDNKWDAYQLMKPYYRREAILVHDENDYSSFTDFVSRHPVFVVKPIGLGAAAGVHKETVVGKNVRDVFDTILKESVSLNAEFPWGDAKTMMVEELIEQSADMASLHPASLQSVRLVTVKVNDQVYIWYPRMDIGRSGSFLINGAAGGIMAIIDPQTGIITKKGIPESGESFEYHPDTGVKILGFQLPEWDGLIEMATELMLHIVPDTRYVGWDMAHTDKGWCVVEGNWAGEFVGDQLGYERGLRYEFEQLIGWKPTQQFWWKY